MPLLALIPILATFAPQLISWIAGDKAGRIASSAAAVVQEITGTADPAKAAEVLAARPDLATNLRLRLAEIEADAAKAQRQAELDTLRAELADVASARGQTLGLAQANSRIAWSAPIISIVVVTGFFLTPLAGKWFDAALDPIWLGALIAGFTAVIQYWLGASASGRRAQEAVEVVAAQSAARADTATAKAVEAVAAVKVAQAAQPPPAPVPAMPASPAGPSRFIGLVDKLLDHEGGYVDHPSDPGGCTNFGITIGTLKAWTERDVTCDDVKALTKEAAREIYFANYWNAVKGDELPPGLDYEVFDFAVNAGVGRSAKTLQTILAKRDPTIKADGAIGPMTIAALSKASLRALIEEFHAARMAHYRSLETWPTFGNGWTRRADAVLATALSA